MILAGILTVVVVVQMGRDSAGLWRDAFYFNLPWQWAAQRGHGIRSVVALAWNAVQVWAWAMLYALVAFLLGIVVNLIW